MSTNPILSDFIRLHYEALLRFARKAAYKDEEDASEAVYRSLFKSPEPQLKDLADVSKIPGWLYQSIERDVLDIRRHRFCLRKDGEARMQATSPEDIAEQHEQQSHAPDVTNSEEHPVFVALRSCWYVLTEPQQSVLELRLLRDPPATPEDAAAALGMKYRDVTSHSTRGLKRLRQCLAQQGITEPRHLFF